MTNYKTVYILAGVVFVFGYMAGIVVMGIAPRLSEHNVAILLNSLGFPAMLVFIEYRLRLLRGTPEPEAKTAKATKNKKGKDGDEKLSEVQGVSDVSTNGASKRRPVARRMS